MAVQEEVGRANVTSETATVFLQPIAAPSILGMLAFAGSTFVMAAWMTGWYGTALSPIYLAPFAGLFGGAVQLLAGMWAYRARDGVATAIHGTWGAFYLAYGLLQFMFFLRPALRPAGVLFPELGFWFIVVAAISWVIALAAMGQRKALASVIMCVSAGATFAAIGLLTGTAWCAIAGGYLFIISSICALYDASAQVLKEVYGHEVLKLGYTQRILSEPGIMAGTGEPGVIHGQR
jgi:succinate-acetate transporter protein